MTPHLKPYYIGAAILIGCQIASAAGRSWSRGSRRIASTIRASVTHNTRQGDTQRDGLPWGQPGTAEGSAYYSLSPC